MSKKKKPGSPAQEQQAESSDAATEETMAAETEAETTETETPAAEAQTEAAPETEAPAAPAEELQAKYDDLNDKYLRMAAEYDNFRKRSQRERDRIHADAVSHAVKALLPTYDNLERAIKAETADAEYKKGVELTMTQLVESLKGLNVTIIDAAPGTPFDPNLHNAVMHIEDEAFAENVIAEAFQQGFQIGDHVIRHSMVKVAN